MLKQNWSLHATALLRHILKMAAPVNSKVKNRLHRTVICGLARREHSFSAMQYMYLDLSYL